MLWRRFQLLFFGNKRPPTTSEIQLFVL